MAWLHFTTRHARSMPWRNGRGATLEYLRLPPDAPMESFDLRLSRAQVAEPGPWSRFVGCTRWVLLLPPTAELAQPATAVGPHWIELEHREPASPVARLRLETWALHEFSGDAETSVLALSAPLEDVNLIVRAVLRTQVRLLRLAPGAHFRLEPPASPDGLNLAHLVAGTLRPALQAVAPHTAPVAGDTLLARRDASTHTLDFQAASPSFLLLAHLAPTPS